jgi:hypothetical protein
MKPFKLIAAGLGALLILCFLGCPMDDSPAGPELTAITVSSPPDKTVYNIGETFNPAGLEVTGTWSDGSQKPVTDYTLGPVDTSTAGTKTVTVTRGNMSAEFTLRVREEGSVLTAITVTALPDKARYLVGELFDPAGLEVTGTWSDGTVETVTGYTLGPVDSSTEGQKTVTVTLNGLETTFTVFVGNPVLTSIEVSAPPEKTVYRIGGAFDPAGLAVTGLYSDGAKEPVTDYALGPVDTAVAGEKTVTLTLGDCSARFSIFVTGGNLLSIAISREPDRKSLSWGEAVDLTGIEVTGIFSDLPDSPVPLTVGTAHVSGYDPQGLPGSQTVRITLEGKRASFAVLVSALFFDYGKPWIKGEPVTGSYSVPVGRTLVLAPVRWGIGANAVYEWKVDGLVQPGAATECFSFKPKTRGEYTVTVSARDGEAYAEATTLVRCVERQGTYKRPKTASSKAYTPDLFGYYPAPGQFVAGMDNHVSNWDTVRDDLGVGKSWVFSLGAWGGSVVYGFDHSVENKPGQYSLHIAGNSFSSIVTDEEVLGWFEPGTVWVMQDENGNGLPDDTWYELAGGETGKPSTIQRYATAYTAGNIFVDNTGSTAINQFPFSTYYGGDFGFPKEPDAYVIYSGTRLGNKLRNGAIIYMAAYSWGYVDNSIPYFRISDAIQQDGSPANLDYIDFVRVQTALAIFAGALGEVSTETGIGFDYSMDH